VGRSLTPGKGGDFAPVAAHGHGAPPASARAGSIVEKQAASRIGAQAEPRTRALGNHFGRGTGHGGEQPLKATLPGDEFDFPITVARDKFVVPFRDAQDFVDRRDPFAHYAMPVEESFEGHAQSGSKPLGFP